MPLIFALTKDLIPKTTYQIHYILFSFYSPKVFVFLIDKPIQMN